jgi:hypothetical protein
MPRTDMIDVPAYLQIELRDGTRITGRVVSYTDPTKADPYGACVSVDADGTTTYVLWAAITRLIVTPLTAQSSE